MQRITFKEKPALFIALILIVFAIMGRVLPHPANFAPVAAVALFSGALLPRRLALVVPLTVMIASDLIIGLHPTIYATWGSFAVIALVSSFKFKKVSVNNVVFSSIAASVFFYITSNFAVWLEGRLYSYTLADLMRCYFNAIPFFRNTLLGDMVFSVSLFGLFALAMSLARQRQESVSVK